jgi:hypothetical protein
MARLKPCPFKNSDLTPHLALGEGGWGIRHSQQANKGRIKGDVKTKNYAQIVEKIAFCLYLIDIV